MVVNCLHRLIILIYIVAIVWLVRCKDNTVETVLNLNACTCTYALYMYMYTKHHVTVIIRGLSGTGKGVKHLAR